MSSDSKPQGALAGQLFLATPSLRDANFCRSVVYMAAHCASEGAFGYILNRPLDQRVADLLPDEQFGPLAEAPVFIGGPVAADKMAFASLHWQARGRQFKCRTHLSVEDAAKALKRGHKVVGFIGYCGWGKGQLESELQQRCWISTAPSRLQIDCPEPASLWSETLMQMGPIYRVMARLPDAFDLN